MFLYLFIKKYIKRLEDVWMGMLAMLFDIPIISINSYYINYYEISVLDKLKLIASKGVANTFFLYDKNDNQFFWNLFANKS